MHGRGVVQSECEQHGKPWNTYVSSRAGIPSALSVVSQVSAPSSPGQQQQQQPFPPPRQSVTPQATVEQVGVDSGE
jgi:hypothetical protein